MEQIVNRVLELLDYKDLSITEFPVGLEWHVEKVIGCIENHSTKVCMIGIWGMGGSGKTTIAKAIYNRIYRPFIGKSFLNIRQVCDLEGHFHLQEKLLYNVLKPDLLKSKRKSVGIGTMMKNEFSRKKLLIGLDEVSEFGQLEMMKNELSRKKLLIVLDEVSEFGQLETLCGSREWFGQGTVIIITTRDIRLLNRLNVNYVYKMDDVMKENEPWEFLVGMPFGEAKPRKDLNELAEKTELLIVEDYQ